MSYTTGVCDRDALLLDPKTPFASKPPALRSCQHMQNNMIELLQKGKQRIGFGTMTLAINAEVRPSEIESIELLLAAADAGCVLFDTADSYCAGEGDMGYCERIIEMSGLTKRDGVLITTKGGYERDGRKWIRNGKPEYLREACEKSLKALKLEAIPLYQFHAPDPDVPIEDSMTAIAKLQNEGKIVDVGVSNFTLDELKKAQSICDIVSVQNPLSIAFGYDRELLEYCEANAIAWLAYAPLGGWKNAVHLADDFPVLEGVAERHQVSPYTIALAWQLAVSPVICPIPGSTQLEHVLANLRASEIKLTTDEVDELTEEAFAEEGEEGEG